MYNNTPELRTSSCARVIGVDVPRTRRPRLARGLSSVARSTTARPRPRSATFARGGGSRRRRTKDARALARRVAFPDRNDQCSSSHAAGSDPTFPHLARPRSRPDVPNRTPQTWRRVGRARIIIVDLHRSTRAWQAVVAGKCRLGAAAWFSDPSIRRRDEKHPRE